MNNRLPRFLRRMNYAITGVLALTGIGWLVLAYLAAPPGEPGPAPHPWNGALLTIHGIAAYAALTAYALVGHAHLRIGWRNPALRPMATALVTSLLVLAATGLGLYYAAGDEARAWSRWTHVAAGMAMPVVLALHIRNGRRAARRAATSGMRTPSAR